MKTHLSLPFLISTQINYLKVPVVVKNNSKTPATLDCNFSVRTDEEGFILRWFLNNDLVYEWKPPNPPKALGPFVDKLDLQYHATNDPNSAYRSMKILNPSSENAGVYTCVVATNTDEDFTSKNMTVIEPESNLVVFYEPPRSSKVNFTCFTSNVYPEPKLYLYQAKTNSDDRNPLQAIEWNTLKHPDGKFSVFTIASAKLNELVPGTLFYCDLRIPGTGYVKRKQLLYYPLPLESSTSKAPGSTADFYHGLALILFYVLCLLIEVVIM